MKLTLFSFILFVISTHVTIAQTTTDDENYKHSGTVHQHHSTTMVESDTIQLRDQKTQKRNSRKYVVAPCDSIPNSNVQGRKMKANYKNQFN